MSQRVYISADYDPASGDRAVVEELCRWGNDSYHKVDFVDTAKVSKGSVANYPDCRKCDLKREFNSQINVSSVVIFVIGDKTKDRSAGSDCDRAGKSQAECWCTPYKQNGSGRQQCKVGLTSTPGPNEDFGNINNCSYLKHEFMQARKKDKKIVVLYNSMRRERAWLPTYMSDYESEALPFWTIDTLGRRVGNYLSVKEALGY